jgi:Ran GTPase-activating protein (RanGAP) involved in mRNA processing and transport
MPRTNRRRQRLLQTLFNQLSRNDSNVTEILMKQFCTFHSLRSFGDEDVLALGSALQKSTHVDRLYLDISGLTSIEGCLTMETYLKSSKSLRELVIHCSNECSSEEQRLRMAEITDRLLLAVRENVFLRQLKIHGTPFTCQALSQSLNNDPNHGSKLQVLALRGADAALYSIGSELDIRNVGTAIQQCHSLKVIDLGDMMEALMLSILRDGVRNHPSVEQLILTGLDAQYWTDAMVTALRCVLVSSTPQLWALQFMECDLPGTVMKPLLESLSTHPTVESLRIQYCTISDHDLDVQRALPKWIASPGKLHTLDLRHSIPNPSFLREILVALSQNTTIKYLNLAGCGVDNKETLQLVEKILQNHSQMTHLSLNENTFGSVSSGTEDAAVSFLKTAIHHSSLTRLDCLDCDLGDTVFNRLASGCTPQEHPKTSTLQKLQLSGNASITDDKGMQYLATVLQLHVPQLKSLCLTDHCFYGEGAVHLAKSLQTVSLVELCLKDGALTTPTLQVFCTMLHNHPTLKIFRMDPMELHPTEGEGVTQMLNKAVQMLTKTIRVCRLQRLHIQFVVDDVDEDDSVEEEGSNQDQDALLHALTTNVTLTDVSLSEDILASQHQEKLSFFNARNSGFQEIIHSLSRTDIDIHDFSDDEDEEYYADGRGRWRTDQNLDRSRDNAICSVPLGLWAHILEAADKQFPDTSMLFHVLSSQIGDLLESWGKSDGSPSKAMKIIQQARNKKRYHAQISE